MKNRNRQNHKLFFLTCFITIFLFLCGISSSLAAPTVNLPVTGQTTKYATGDDGDIQAGQVWPVSRFKDNGDGTVSDNLTGLMWLKDAGCLGSQTWAAALKKVDDLNAKNITCSGYTANYTDWHLPNINELESLVNVQQNSSTWLNSQGFTNVQSSNYWSATTDATYTSVAWRVDMYGGIVDGNGKSNDHYVWPVRLGQARSFDNSIISTTISPQAAITAGAQWRVGGGAWQNSSASVSPLSSGSHTVEFKDVAGYKTPVSQVVTTQQSQTTPVAATYAVDERQALIDLYNSTDGTNWTNKTNWLGAAGTEGTWYGITCDVSGRVVKIDLSSNNLKGTIPSSIGNFTNLTDLWLFSNQLSGAIPTQIGNLTNLTTLSLQGNQLNGTIPVELGNLTKLTYLGLWDNQLSGTIPTQIGNLANLTTLYLGNNKLSGTIPSFIGNLTNLTELHLYSNQLSGAIPVEIGNLTNLKSLYLYSNQLIGAIPTSFINLTNLNNSNDFRWNSIYTTDTSLRSFLNTKQNGGDWESTQTITPTNLAAGNITENSIALNWSKILYTADAGGYEVYFSNNSSGQYSLFGTTSSKTIETLAVTSLSPNTTYYFKLRAKTNNHTNNQNTVYSEDTPIIQAKTNAPPTTTTTSTTTTSTTTTSTTTTSTTTTTTTVPPTTTTSTTTTTTIPPTTTTTTTTTTSTTTTTIPIINPPYTPVATNQSEFDEPIISSNTYTMIIGAYYHPDGYRQAKTLWEIRRADRPYNCSDYPVSFSHTSSFGDRDMTNYTIDGLESGVKYAWHAKYCDESGSCSSFSKEYFFKTGKSEIDSNVSLKEGESAADFKMVSFVQWPENQRSDMVFGKNIDWIYNTKKFRIGSYDPTAGDGAYIQYGETLQVKPGKAFWFFTRKNMNLNVNGIPVSKNSDFEVALQYNASNANGWNMISCPNASNYYWYRVEAAQYDNSGKIIYGPVQIGDLSEDNPYVDKKLWRWNNGSYLSDTNLMEKYSGYFAKAKTSNVSLRFTARQQVKLSNPSVLAETFWAEAKRYVKDAAPSPKKAIAYSEDEPPKPIEGFSQEAGGSSKPVGTSSCFIESLYNK